MHRLCKFNHKSLIIIKSRYLVGNENQHRKREKIASLQLQTTQNRLSVNINVLLIQVQLKVDFSLQECFEEETFYA